MKKPSNKTLHWTGISMAPAPTGLVVDIFV